MDGVHEEGIVNRATIDLWVGIVVAIVIVGGLFSIVRSSGILASTESKMTYVLKAEFDDIGGLKVRAPVKSAGVVVGRVAEVRFAPASYRAIVTMNIDGRYHFPKDTLLTVNTSGLLGEQYVGIEIGSAAEMLADGDIAGKTQSAVVLEKLIGQFMYNKAQDDGSK